jgi:hypothetical protein
MTPRQARRAVDAALVRFHLSVEAKNKASRVLFLRVEDVVKAGEALEAARAALAAIEQAGLH